MISLPSTRDEWTALGRRVGWVLVRFQILGIVLGAVATVLVQLLTGFWDFRTAHEQQLHEQWKTVIEAQDEFETQLALIASVLRGKTLPMGGAEYGSAALKYTRAMEAISRSLPATSSQVADYIDAIAALRRYYDASPPQPGTDDWMIFYGEYRLDFERLVAARENYFNVLGSELGDYVRYVTNS